MTIQKDPCYRVFAPIAPSQWPVFSEVFQVLSDAERYRDALLASDPFADARIETVNRDGIPLN
jgi:hypothetical protein